MHIIRRNVRVGIDRGYDLWDDESRSCCGVGGWSVDGSGGWGEGEGVWRCILA